MGIPRFKNMFKSLTLFICVAMLIPLFGLGQQQAVADSISSGVAVAKSDTASSIARHSPRKATLYSMVLPGLGQAYNKKYWKIPIIYAGFGVFYYFIKANDSEYQKYKEAYYHALINEDGTLPPINEYEAKYETDFLLSAKNYYRRNRDLSYILTGLWYVLNIVDATVDAHLFSWEVNDDLSLRVEPGLMAPVNSQFSAAGGLKLTLSF